MSTIRRSRASSRIFIAVVAGAAIAGCGSTGGSHSPRVSMSAFQLDEAAVRDATARFADSATRGDYDAFAGCGLTTPNG